jgi:hypothetical protein
MKNILIILLLILFGVAPALAQGSDDKPPKMSAAEEAIRITQSRRFEAMMRGEMKLLDKLLDDDLTYTHSNGIVDTKTDLIESLKTGQVKYDSIESTDIHVRFFRETAVVTGQAHMKVRLQGPPLDFRVRFTEVYVKRGKQWLLVAWQSTRMTER